MTLWKKNYIAGIFKSLWTPSNPNPKKKQTNKNHPTEQTHQTHHQYSIWTIQQNPPKNPEKVTSKRKSPTPCLFHALRVGGPRTPMKLSFLLFGFDFLRKLIVLFYRPFEKNGLPALIRVKVDPNLWLSWKIFAQVVTMGEENLPQFSGWVATTTACDSSDQNWTPEGVDIPQDWCLPEVVPPISSTKIKGKNGDFGRADMHRANFAGGKSWCFFFSMLCKKSWFMHPKKKCIWYILRFLKITPWLQ